MFPTLFNVKINWGFFFGAAVLIVVFIPDLSIWRFLALMISVHQFMLLFYSHGYVIPVRYWAGAMMCLQMLVGSSFAYSGLDDVMYYKYQMQVPEEVYFSYAIPAVILFILGLHSSGRLSGEKVDEKSVRQYVGSNPDVPYYFIAVGFLASVVSPYFGSALANVFYLLSSFKYIGAFMLILGGAQMKLLPMILVYGSIVASSLQSAMFHDLLTWLFFLLAILAIKYKPSVQTKAIFTAALLVLVVVIQQLKGLYRESITYGEGSLGEFEDVFVTARDEGGFFSLSSIAQSNVRINQGFIVTYAMSHVPEKQPFSRGKELYRVLEAAFLPRIIAPNKLEAGDNSLVYKFTGMSIRPGTSMSMSAMGDGYVNFGVLGGCIFMFVLGWVFNQVLNGFHRYGKVFPILLLFTPLVFYYPIRPDTALQTSLGHLVKSCFLLYMMIIFWKTELKSSAISGKVKKSMRGKKVEESRA